MTPPSPVNRETLDSLRAMQRPGMPSLLERIIPMFQEESVGLLSQLEAAVERSEAQEIHSTAHRLKSVAGNVGAEHLSELCRELEMMGLENQLEKAVSTLADLREEQRRVSQALAEELSSITGK